MKAEKRTPPAPTDGAQTCVGARPSCGPYVYKDSHPRRQDKPKLRPRSARFPRARSRYRPGSDYRPPEEALARRQGEVLELLKERGPRGATGLDAPGHLSLSLSQRICELRQMGYRIDTVREEAGDVRIARYVLVEEVGTPCDQDGTLVGGDKAQEAV